MTEPIWYEINKQTDGQGALVDLQKFVGFKQVTPADQRFMPRRADGEDVSFIDATLPVAGRYNQTTQMIFSGNWREVNDELLRIKALLLKESNAVTPE